MTGTNSPSPLEIYKLLPGNNCGKCLLPSCLAFAAAVAKGDREFEECPDARGSFRDAFAARNLPPKKDRESDQAEFIDQLKEKTRRLDFSRIAPLIGAHFDGRNLVIKSLGKEFRIDQEGEMVSDCHVIPWVVVPTLSYITNPTHSEPSGEWISFRELKGGIDWQGLFTSRCEKVLKQLADNNPSLLADLIDLFNGRKVDWYQADIALVLHPLPHIPILICYQAKEDDLDSVLTIFFDRACTENLHIKPLFTLSSGLTQMFVAIAGRTC